MIPATILTKFAAWFRERLALSAETDFERGYWPKVQRAHAAMLPLGEIGKGTAHAFIPSRPGTLTVKVGDETVTLDPMSSHEKYLRDSAKADELLERIRIAGSAEKIA